MVRFLQKLPLIMQAGPPAKIIWFNCMTWLFDREKEAHQNGWIDYFGFQSEYQKRCLIPKLEEIRPGVRTFSYLPYFNTGRSNGITAPGTVVTESGVFRAMTPTNLPRIHGGSSIASWSRQL